MLRFSLDAIASFSDLPLQLATYAGILSAGVAFIAIPVVIATAHRRLLPAGLQLADHRVLLLGGIQLIVLGVIGEYVGRIYDEVKHRPLYIVRESATVRSGAAPARGAPARAGLSARHPRGHPLAAPPADGGPRRASRAKAR